METKSKKAIKTIAELSITCSDKLGDILAPILFEDDKCALYLCRENRSKHSINSPFHSKNVILLL